jgi:hypothetical protein
MTRSMIMSPKKRQGPFRAVRPAGLILMAAFLAAGCGDEPTNVPEPPIIHSVDKSVVSPGDTITITGEKFATSTTGNRVTFNNSLGRAYPFSATARVLEVVVSANAATGPMTVSAEDGPASEPVQIEVLRDVGEVWVIGGVNLNYSFKVPDPTGLSRYLIIPFSATSKALTWSYTLEPVASSTYLSLKSKQVAGRGGTEYIAARFERKLREDAVEYLQRLGYRPGPVPSKVPLQGPPAQTRTFKVLNDPEGSLSNPAYYSTVTATLRYEGVHVLIYSDDANPPGGFNQADYDQLGADYDNLYYPTDVAAFGSPSDIDGDSKIAILYTQVVDNLTPDGTAGSGFIAGFVNLADLGPNVFPAGTTNGMEVFYIMVPDSLGVTGNVFTKAAVQVVARETMAHEFEHMISYGYRFVDLGGQTNWAYLQVTWLEEGMAHIAEELNGMNRGNESRAELYLNDPGAVSLMGDDTLEQRGCIYLFLRYLSDRLQNNAIFYSLVRNNYVGARSIESVSGEKIFTTFADFLAALYLSNSSVPHESKFDFTTIDYPADFFPHLTVSTRSVSDGPVLNAAIKNAAADFYIFEDISDAALKMTVKPSQTASALRVVVARLQ